ncbi:MAG: substrate-binding domain-containing protein [Pirellulales bacterium]
MHPKSHFTRRRFSVYIAAAWALVALVGCRAYEPPPADTLTLATTTSTQDSGLLDALLPAFRAETGIDVKVIAVGSGQAIELGRRGDADVLLTHAPAAEDKFVAAGNGIERCKVMYNDFVLVGAANDPADIRNQASVVDALKSIADRSAPFVSRGDESGTHQKERGLWAAVGRAPSGDWYLRSGSGMAQTLRIASEKQAYTLSDRATFLAHRESLRLAILSQGDPLLRNEYSVMLVNPARHAHVRVAAARRFADFLLAPATQARIAEFGRAKFGQPLFYTFEAAARP